MNRASGYPHAIKTWMTMMHDFGKGNISSSKRTFNKLRLRLAGDEICKFHSFTAKYHQTRPYNLKDMGNPSIPKHMSWKNANLVRNSSEELYIRIGHTGQINMWCAEREIISGSTYSLNHIRRIASLSTKGFTILSSLPITHQTDAQGMLERCQQNIIKV